MRVTDPVPATGYPILRYRDGVAAVRWLREAFGVRESIVVPTEDGNLRYGEVHLHGAVLMLGTVRDDDAASNPRPYEIYLAIGDDASVVEAHHARAVAAGARITRELETTDYGSREYTALDCEGNEWSFGTYRPTADVAPA